MIKAVNKYYDKGYVETLPILNKIKEQFKDKIILDISYNISYEECIKRKKDCHIIIDECKTGSFHKTTLEGLMLGCIVIVNISKELCNKHKQLYSKELPIINANLINLEKEIIKLINLGKENLEKIAIENNKIFIQYWNKEIVYNEYKNIYENLFTSK